MAEGRSTVRSLRGIQQGLFLPELELTAKPFVEPKGVVYTKPWVVELMLDLAGYCTEANLVDCLVIEPSAGDGAFLVPMVERLVCSCRGQGRPVVDCLGSLIAYELDPESARRARTLVEQALAKLGVGNSECSELANAWVRHGDYLIDGAILKADFVIGNPPYVRMEEIPLGTAALYRSAYRTMKGRADLYVAFFEAALHQLKQGGVCSFICADRWMRNQYGSELRELVTAAYAVEVVIEMHNAEAFEAEVDAYPAITVIRRSEQGRAIVAQAGADVEVLGTKRIVEALRAKHRGEQGPFLAGLRVAIVDAWFQNSDPWPCSSPEQMALLRRLEDQFPAIEAGARIGIGVATGNDGLFITKDPDLVEQSRMLKLAIARDIREGVVKWSGNYLVDPWNGEGLVVLEQYPKLKAYLEKNAEALKLRHTAAKNAKGWYRTIDRVTHRLTAMPKLYIADIKSELDPVLDRGGTYPHHNLYFIESDAWDLEVLGGLLISSVGHFFVESYGVRMRGGYFRFQAQYLRRIRVPNPESISVPLADELREAFRSRNRKRATAAALIAYGIGLKELELALGR